jgi:hypothetical protein
MNTADYALIISLIAAATSVAALLWNVWQKYIFVKPALQVTLGIYRVLQPQPGRNVARPLGPRLLNLSVTNMGPGPVILHACMVKSKADRWRRGRYGLLNPIHGDPAAAEPISVGPFSGGLPSKIEPGEVKSFYFPYDKDCFLKEAIYRAGICDTYGRNNWCRRRDIKKAASTYATDFLKQEQA